MLQAFELERFLFDQMSPSDLEAPKAWLNRAARIFVGSSPLGNAPLHMPAFQVHL
jgi:hypothetical protein